MPGSILLPSGIFSVLPILIVSDILIRYVRRTPLYELEILERGTSSTRDARYGTVTASTVYYLARYFDRRNRSVTFKSPERLLPHLPAFHAGDHIRAYALSKGKYVIPEVHMDVYRKIIRYAWVLYLLYILIENAFHYAPYFTYWFGPFGQTLQTLVHCLPLMLIAAFILFSSLKSLLFRKKLKEGQYREVPAVISEIVQVGTGSDRMYYPVFTYFVGNERRTLRGKAGSSSPRYKVGDDATLYQDITTLEVREKYDF